MDADLTPQQGATPPAEMSALRPNQPQILHSLQALKLTAQLALWGISAVVLKRLRSNNQLI